MFKFVNKMKNRKGFTLIELVVVVAILGILALIAIPRFANVREDAQTNADKTTATTLLNAAELYYVETGSTPTTTQLVDGGYLREWPDGASFTEDTTSGTYIVTYDNPDHEGETIIVPEE